jgi:hypothetical protein
VHAGTADDFNELAYLYRCTYPHATDTNLAADIKPQEMNSWITYQSETGEIIIAMFIRLDGLCWLLAKPEESDSLNVMNGFLALVEEARAVLARRGVRGLEIIHAPSLEPLARRLEEQGLIGKKTAIIRSYRFDEHTPNRKVN